MRTRDMDTEHWFPLHDTITHDLDGDCVCGPTEQPFIPDGETQQVWLIIHHPLQVREQ